ncbi:hypothetical protein, partial [Hymenobacter sp.]|uniref:hypothetical protein n=1 Tax=Hymenobacter sp. TaxID=1898978 RepID=UPI00286C8617
KKKKLLFFLGVFLTHSLKLILASLSPKTTPRITPLLSPKIQRQGKKAAVVGDLSTYPQLNTPEMWISPRYLGHCTSISSLM